MNKWLLITLLLTCVSLIVYGHEEGRFSSQEPHKHLVHSSATSKEDSAKMVQEREKRMTELKKSDEGSFGYAWNVGNGVSYMKIHVGKTTNTAGPDSLTAAQHEVFHSLRNGWRPHLHDQNVKTGYEKVHEDISKMSQHISSQNYNNLSAKPSIVNQKTAEKENQEFAGDKFPRFSFNNEQNKDIKEAHTKFHDFSTGWPQHQAQSLKEFNIGQILKNIQPYVIEGDIRGTIENKPVSSFEYHPGFGKDSENQKNLPFYGLHQSHGVGGRHDYKGSDLDENNSKGVSKVVGNPLNVNTEQNHSLGNDDDIFKYSEDTNDKIENNEELKIPNEFTRSQEEARSSQNFVSKHESNEATEHIKTFEEPIKTTDEENIQKVVSETTQTPQIAKEEENVHPQIANGFGSGHLNGMHHVMNQKHVNDQVERIKQMQQKIIESYFPGAGIYQVLDGNAHNGFFNPGHPMRTEENIRLLQHNEYHRGSEPFTRIAYGLQNNPHVFNNNYPKDRHVLNDNNEKLSYSNVRLGYSIEDSKMHHPYLNNYVPSPNFLSNPFSGGHKLVNEENNRIHESHSGKEETHWRPQRYSINSNTQHQTDIQNDKLKNGVSDERKGREIKPDFENGGIEHLDQKETHVIDEHTKEHFQGKQEFQEAKTIHPGNEYSQFHHYPHQEPQVKVITKAVPVHKELKIPVPQMVRQPIMIPFPYRVLEPYPFQIPVPVTVEKKVEVPVEKVIRYPVEKPVPIKVIKEVKVPVSKPYPVKVPVYKIKYVHHNKKKNHE